MHIQISATDTDSQAVKTGRIQLSIGTKLIVQTAVCIRSPLSGKVLREDSLE